MSLEQTLEQTNELLKQVITILQTGLSAPAELGKPEVKATRTRKAAAQADVVDTPVVESIYWLIEKHNTVYEQKAGDTAPSIQGAVQVTKEVYDAKKQEYAALGKSPSATTTAATTATDPAHGQPTAAAVVDAAPASTADASSPAAQSAETAPPASTAVSEVPFQAIVDVATKMNKSAAPGMGREGLLALLKKWLPGDDRPSVTKLKDLNRNADILADAEAQLAAAEAAANKPAEEFDPLA